jgi:HAD superfamily hydrolase (TIGR01549 family)
VLETLKHFAAKKLAVLSNKHQRLTEKVLEVLGIRPFFAAVRGGGTDLDLKPSPQPLTALLQEMGVAPARTLMVGDKPADVLAGKGAGAHTLGVTYGYGDPAALSAAAPEVLVSHLAELKNLLV